ncbi:DUF664 domain-containing protein [Phytomonospora sp. NPDC050363]|uniref:mycothiol transferase n=1 Tax=Phytomonospora sp. NPDC050363 TaxID=3155642 RepID=UPI0033C939C4
MTENEMIIHPPVAGSELDTLVGCLERNRLTFAWKCGGLDAAGLNTRVASSTITLGGLLKHMALVEDDMFSQRLTGAGPAEPWAGVDFDADPDWEWRTAADDSPEELMALWERSVDLSRANVRAAGDPEHVAAYVSGAGESPYLRLLLVDMIEEYARHTGHADLIRESVDGLVGEGRPQ